MRKNLPRILYGFLSSSIDPINMSIPWKHSDKDGLFKMNYSTVDAEYDNLVCWAKTNKFERVMLGDFGLDVNRYMFEPENVAKDNLQENARKQLQKYFSHLEVLDLKFFSMEDDETLQANQIRMILKVKIKKNGEVVEVNQVLGEVS